MRKYSREEFLESSSRACLTVDFKMLTDYYVELIKDVFEYAEKVQGLNQYEVNLDDYYVEVFFAANLEGVSPSGHQFLTLLGIGATSVIEKKEYYEEN